MVGSGLADSFRPPLRGKYTPPPQPRQVLPLTLGAIQLHTRWKPQLLTRGSVPRSCLLPPPNPKHRNAWTNTSTFTYFLARCLVTLCLLAEVRACANTLDPILYINYKLDALIIIYS